MLLATSIQQTIAQTETFDIATFTPPKDWKKTTGTLSTAYSNINNTTGAFCVIALYPSSASLGDAQKDFKAEWKNRVVTLFNGDANPKTDMQTSADGWKAVSAAAPIKIDSAGAYVILTVFSGFGNRFSILVTLNDKS